MSIFDAFDREDPPSSPNWAAIIFLAVLAAGAICMFFAAPR